MRKGIVGVSGPQKGYQGSSTLHLRRLSQNKGEGKEQRRRVRCKECGKLVYKDRGKCFFCGNKF